MVLTVYEEDSLARPTAVGTASLPHFDARLVSNVESQLSIVPTAKSGFASATGGILTVQCCFELASASAGLVGGGVRATTADERSRYPRNLVVSVVAATLGGGGTAAASNLCVRECRCVRGSAAPPTAPAHSPSTPTD